MSSDERRTSRPWENEPDRKEWRHRGLPCLIVRSEITGALCGYVGVAPNHPLYGQDGDELGAHGGITYRGHCHGPICHVAQPGEPDEVYWFGFDCAHAWDLSPKLLDLFKTAVAMRLCALGVRCELLRELLDLSGHVGHVAIDPARRIERFHHGP